MRQRALRHPAAKLPYFDHSRGCYCIPVGHGKVTLVDADDLPRVVVSHWSLEGGGHAQGYHDGRLQMLHRVIMDAPPGKEVDHIHGNRLDNRKSELRICTGQQNSCNTRGKPARGSRFKGVTWKKSNRKWCAQITDHRRVIHLGLFANDEDAARAYDVAARQRFGEYARPNFAA